jgi:signal transduction histidine kinase
LHLRKIQLKSSGRPPAANARFRTDASLQGERQLLDEIARECPAFSELATRLDQARRQTDLRLASERGEMEEALFDGSKDLLEQRTARGSADAALVDRDALLAAFGHDLRNLLNVISVNAELSLKQGEGNSRSLGDVQRTVRRMDGLIANLLDHARLKAGTFHVAFDWRNAAEVVREAVEIFRPLALARSLSLEATLPSADLPVRIDPDRIFQVLSNLFSNAINVTPEGGSITVSAARVDDVVQITVRDSGRGIAETDLERIFKPYCQLDGAERRGLGLGLFISKSIVQAHGGQIWAESKLGGGSTFFFTVPGSNGAPRGEASPAVLEAVAV